MTRESCVKHPARNPTIVLRDDYLRLCDYDYCAAMVLSQHEHWHNVKLDSHQQASEHNQAAIRSSEVPSQNTELWVYMSQPEMKAQLMGLFGDKAVTAGYKKVLDKGFLHKRTNPRFTWDKTLQYLFIAGRVQEAIDALAPLREEGDDAEIHESAELQGSRVQKCGLDTAEMRHAEREDADSKTQKCGTLKTSSETSRPKTSTEKNPPQVPPGSSAPEEEDLSSASGIKPEIKNENVSNEQKRVEDMLGKIGKITGTIIEIEALRPLALECVRREHKDAWTHTLTVLRNKMECEKKPINANRFAFTVLKNALKSPVPAKAKQQGAKGSQQAPQEQAVPAQAAPSLSAACQRYYDDLDDAEKTELDKQAVQQTDPDWRKNKSCIKSNRDRLITVRMGVTPTVHCIANGRRGEPRRLHVNKDKK